jgi:hypothetical protein
MVLMCMPETLKPPQINSGEYTWHERFQIIDWWIWVDVKATQIMRSVFGKRRAESELFPSRAAPAPHNVTFCRSISARFVMFLIALMYYNSHSRAVGPTSPLARGHSINEGLKCAKKEVSPIQQRGS